MGFFERIDPKESLMKKIILIDDDIVLTSHYEEALKAQGFDVDVFHSVSQSINQDFGKYDLVVCDLMMPDDSFFGNIGTRDGLLTGLRMVDSIRADGNDVPCILLTNMNLPATLDRVSEEISTMKDVILMKKSEFNPAEFASIAMGLIDGSARAELSPDIRKRFSDSIILKAPIIPGFLTIDLKKLFKK